MSLLVFALAVGFGAGLEMRGMTFTGDRYCPEVPMDSPAAEASLRHLASTGCNFVAIVVTWYQETMQANHIYPISRAFAGPAAKPGFWNYVMVSETPRAVVAAIRLAHSLGMKVLLKPHIDLVNDEGGMWRGDIMAIGGWWEAYERMLLFWARIAERENVAMLSVSCELVAVSRDETSWRKLIAKTRRVFRGNLTAAANWADIHGVGELTDKSWWDALDYIGCDEYMPLPKSPTLQSAVEAWMPLVAQFKQLADKFKKPFLLTEVGYCSGGCVPQQHATPAGEAEQAMHYEAVLWVAEENSAWFKGVFFWNWVTDDAFGEWKDGSMCMDPKWQQAELVLRRYYNATAPQPPRNFAAKPRCKCTL